MYGLVFAVQENYEIKWLYRKGIVGSVCFSVFSVCTRGTFMFPIFTIHLCVGVIYDMVVYLSLCASDDHLWYAVLERSVYHMLFVTIIVLLKFQYGPPRHVTNFLFSVRIWTYFGSSARWWHSNCVSNAVVNFWTLVLQWHSMITHTCTRTHAHSFLFNGPNFRELLRLGYSRLVQSLKVNFGNCCDVAWSWWL